MRGKKKKRNRDGTWAPGRELWKKKGSFTLGTAFNSWEISQDRQGTPEAQRKVQLLACGRQNWEGPAQMVLTTSLHYSRRCESSAGVHRGWVLKLDFSGLPWGKDWGWLPRDSLQRGPGLQQGCAKGRRLAGYRSPPPQPHSHSWVLTAVVAPPLRGLAVCKCLWAAHMWRWGWNLSHVLVSLEDLLAGASVSSAPSGHARELLVLLWVCRFGTSSRRPCKCAHVQAQMGTGLTLQLPQWGQVWEYTQLWQVLMGFPGGSDGTASACNAGDPGSIPGLGIPWRRKWQSTPVFLPGKSHGWRSLVGYSPCGCKELDKTEWLHFHSRS